MGVASIYGTIRRRALVNFRVDPGELQATLPEPFRVRTVGGYGMAGVCLIRLERMRPGALDRIPLGFASENVAYRVAVEWDEPRTGDCGKASSSRAAIPARRCSACSVGGCFRASTTTADLK